MRMERKYRLKLRSRRLPHLSIRNQMRLPPLHRLRKRPPQRSPNHSKERSKPKAHLVALKTSSRPYRYAVRTNNPEPPHKPLLARVLQHNLPPRSRNPAKLRQTLL